MITLAPEQRARIFRESRQYFKPFFNGSVYDWLQDNFWVTEGENQGWFSARGREYMIETLNDWDDPNVTDSVACWGTQLGKTTVIIGGMLHTVYHEPGGILWVMNTQDQAKGISRERWEPSVRKCPVLKDTIPQGKDRHLWSVYTQIFNGATVNFGWSNSPGKLASRPARKVIQDETDKFKKADNEEAGASYLADERTSSFSDPFRFKGSTPTTTNGVIWQAFLKSDQRRYYVPCPHCQKKFVIIWNPKFTQFKLDGSEAHIHWDKEAKMKNGRWDYDRVEKSAHVKCPYCEKSIYDKHKTLMNRGGGWVVKNPYARKGFRGRHLPSWYSLSPQKSYGALAAKFLQNKAGVEGVQGFVNSDCAEPWVQQGRTVDRFEIWSTRSRPIGEKSNLRNMLTIDHQGKRPFWWFVVREWDKVEGNSRLKYFGNFDDPAYIQELIQKYEIPLNCVGIDCGWQKQEDQEVYQLCADNSKILKSGFQKVYAGFLPMMGHKEETTWKDDQGNDKPWGIKPAKTPNLRHKLNVLMFNSPKFKDYLERLRKGKTIFKYELKEKTSGHNTSADDYIDQINSEIRTDYFDKKSGQYLNRWQLVTEGADNHLLDCEVMQLVLAKVKGYLRKDERNERKTN